MALAPRLAGLRPPLVDWRLPLPPSPVQVWAVEDTSAQVTWGSLPPGTVTAEAGHASTRVDHHGGPGGLVLEGLAPDTLHAVRLTWDGGESILAAHTLAPPPGALLARIATVSDLHLGATRFGALRTIGERTEPGRPPPPWRCAAAALSEARRWGADLVVVKGDVAHHRRVEDFAQAGDLLDRFADLDVLVVPGNHDVDAASDIDVPDALGARSAPIVRGVAIRDVPGLRVLAADTTVAHRGPGRLSAVADDLVAAAAEAGGPTLVALHHQLQRHRVPTYWPPGISGAEGRPFLDRLVAANADSIVTAGHTHRNRARRHGPVVVTEVGSTKDWPGVWAGYAVHEGGIRQVVRRIQAPEAIGWIEQSRRALGGLWDRWSPGPLHQRCFTVRWSRP